MANKRERSALSPKGEDAPKGKEEPMTKETTLLADFSPDANSQCLHGKPDLKALPSLSPTLPSLKAPEGISKAEKNETFARRKLSGSIGWEALMAADDPKDENHLSAVETCLREAKRLGVNWRPPDDNAVREPFPPPARLQPYLEVLQEKGLTPNVVLAELKDAASQLTPVA